MSVVPPKQFSRKASSSALKSSKPSLSSLGSIRPFPEPSRPLCKLEPDRNVRHTNNNLVRPSFSDTTRITPPSMPSQTYIPPHNSYPYPQQSHLVHSANNDKISLHSPHLPPYSSHQHPTSDSSTSQNRLPTLQPSKSVTLPPHVGHGAARPTIPTSHSEPFSYDMTDDELFGSDFVEMTTILQAGNNQSMQTNSASISLPPQTHNGAPSGQFKTTGPQNVGPAATPPPVLQYVSNNANAGKQTLYIDEDDLLEDELAQIDLMSFAAPMVKKENVSRFDIDDSFDPISDQLFQDLLAEPEFKSDQRSSPPSNPTDTIKSESLVSGTNPIYRPNISNTKLSPSPALDDKMVMENASLRLEIQSLQMELQKYESNVTELNSLVQQKEGAVSLLRSKLTMLEKQMIESQVSYSQKSASEGTTARAQLDSLQKQIKHSKAEREALEQEIAELHSKEKSLLQALKDEREKNSAIHAESKKKLELSLNMPSGIPAKTPTSHSLTSSTPPVFVKRDLSQSQMSSEDASFEKVAPNKSTNDWFTSISTLVSSNKSSSRLTLDLLLVPLTEPQSIWSLANLIANSDILLSPSSISNPCSKSENLAFHAAESIQNTVRGILDNSASISSLMETLLTLFPPYTTSFLSLSSIHSRIGLSNAERSIFDSQRHDLTRGVDNICGTLRQLLHITSILLLRNEDCRILALHPIPYHFDLSAPKAAFEFAVKSAPTLTTPSRSVHESVEKLPNSGRAVNSGFLQSFQSNSTLINLLLDTIYSITQYFASITSSHSISLPSMPFLSTSIALLTPSLECLQLLLQQLILNLSSSVSQLPQSGSISTLFGRLSKIDAALLSHLPSTSSASWRIVVVNLCTDMLSTIWQPYLEINSTFLLSIPFTCTLLTFLSTFGHPANHLEQIRFHHSIIKFFVRSISDHGNHAMSTFIASGIRPNSISPSNSSIILPTNNTQNYFPFLYVCISVMNHYLNYFSINYWKRSTNKNPSCLHDRRSVVAAFCGSSTSLSLLNPANVRFHLLGFLSSCLDLFHLVAFVTDDNQILPMIYPHRYMILSMLNRCSELKNPDCSEFQEKALEIQSRLFQLGLSQLQAANFGTDSSSKLDAPSQSLYAMEDMEVDPDAEPLLASSTTNTRSSREPRSARKRKR